MTDARAEFREAVDRLVAATARLDGDRSPEAFLEWHRAVDELKRLHGPVVERALERARRVRT